MTDATSNPALFETHLPWKLRGRGKVRDIYEIDEHHLLIVTTDRLSAFDHVLPTPIPDRGRVLVALSHFWLGQLKGIIGHHLANDNHLQTLLGELSEEEKHALRGRTELVRAAKVFPVECVVRGYVAGSAWTEYQKSSSVCGVSLPKGLAQSQKLPEPIFTPATKATSGH
ncbi:MAG: phosphoribosylaminoimidazolesuccinocarboxamide synthase, partial [Calditrichaeota bacterium]|nr:phosphoribosylaminoimidazolesuccinocarboxamide synthase [Calditrichota bacterium]